MLLIMFWGMWFMLQQETPSDYVLATGTTHKLSEFLEIAFQYFDLDYEKYVMVNKKFIRPNEPQKLCGDSSKAQKFLNWKPSLNFTELIYEMCKSKRVNRRYINLPKKKTRFKMHAIH